MFKRKYIIEEWKNENIEEEKVLIEKQNKQKFNKKSSITYV